MLDNDLIRLWIIQFARDWYARALAFFDELSKLHAGTFQRNSLLIFIYRFENHHKRGEHLDDWKIEKVVHQNWYAWSIKKIRFSTLDSHSANDPIIEFWEEISRQTRVMGLETGKFDLLFLSAVITLCYNIKDDS